MLQRKITGTNALSKEIGLKSDILSMFYSYDQDEGPGMYLSCVLHPTSGLGLLFSLLSALILSFSFVS